LTVRTGEGQSRPVSFAQARVKKLLAGFLIILKANPHNRQTFARYILSE
jgi:hypothetical protein